MTTVPPAGDEPGPHEPGFLLYPAVDVRHGRVVRLVQGDAAAETVYGADPTASAVDLVAGGATRLHVVDLDAAFGKGSAAAIVEAIAIAVGPGIEVQVGGGLRDDDAIDRMLAHGAARAILGTVALTDAPLVARAIARHGADRIAAALDVRGPVAVGDGWTRHAGAVDLGRATAALLDAGVRRFIVTAIERDGTLAGPDLALLRRVAAAGVPEVVASGGIRSLDDLVAVADVGCVGAVVGRALYAGGMDLGACVAWAAERARPDDRR